MDPRWSPINGKQQQISRIRYLPFFPACSTLCSSGGGASRIRANVAGPPPRAPFDETTLHLKKIYEGLSRSGSTVGFFEGLAGTSLRRPGDVTWFLYTDHAHLVVDCAVAGVYQKSMLRDGLWRRAGAAARMRERHKIRADARADHPVQYDHTFVPRLCCRGRRASGLAGAGPAGQIGAEGCPTRR